MSRELLSVVIATRNRAPLLARCLEAIACCDYSPDGYELVVVDNGSTDATPEVVERERRHGTLDLRLIREPVPGLARARNAGARAASGRAVIFLDDDGLVSEDWLTGFARSLRGQDRDLVQGAISPTFASPPPLWLTPRFWPRLGEVDQGPDPEPLRGQAHGGNLGVAGRVFHDIGYFREDLGLGASGLGEDSDFAARARAAGFSILYEPLALMYHFIPHSRLTRPVFLRRHYQSGLSQAAFQRYEESLPRTLSCWLRESTRRLLSAAFAPDPGAAMELLCDLAEHTGRVAKILASAIRRGSSPNA